MNTFLPTRPLSAHPLSKRLTPALRQLAMAALAITATAASFAATTEVRAASQPVYFSAELAAPVAKTTDILQGVIWKCEATRCVAPRETARPENVCRRLVRKHGAVTSFAVRGQAFDPAALAACNAQR